MVEQCSNEDVYRPRLAQKLLNVQDTFMYICNKLSPALIRTDTVLRRALTVDHMSRILQYCPLDWHSSLNSMRNSHETCQCIIDVLMVDYIKLPSGDRLNQTVHEFKTKWGVPQCFGANDGSHLPISAPDLLNTDYYNRKGWYSMLVQGLIFYLFRLYSIIAESL